MVQIPAPAGAAQFRFHALYRAGGDHEARPAIAPPYAERCDLPLRRFVSPECERGIRPPEELPC